MTGAARYDDVADFYAAGWTDDLDEPVSGGLLRLLGPVAGRQVLEIACGHGRITRELARRGAQVTGVDIAQALIGKARAAEEAQPLGIRYLGADAADAGQLADTGLLTGTGSRAQATFDAVVCSFGLSDIDDLDGVIGNARRLLRPGGRFVCSLLHPCFPGGPGVCGSWPSGGTYRDEGWWQADGELSSLRRQVGANHRTLATYLNTLRRHGLWLDEMAEPEPEPGWATRVAGAARGPVFLVMRCVVTGPP